MSRASTGPELAELIRRFVLPGNRYLRLGGSASGLRGREREAFVGELARAAWEITPDQLGILFEGGWRPRKTAAWLVAVAGRTEFRSRISELLLESLNPYAGAAYCVALADFGEAADADALCGYLDHYLLRTELHYDQGVALGALLHLDARLGAERGARYLGAGGLWQPWIGAQRGRYQVREAQENREHVGMMCAFAAEVRDVLRELELQP